MANTIYNQKNYFPCITFPENICYYLIKCKKMAKGRLAGMVTYCVGNAV